MITTRGIGFVIAAVLLFILARLTGIGWLYLVDSVLWGIVFVSAVLPWLCAVGLGARRQVRPSPRTGGDARPAEGDPVQIELTLGNRLFWPRFFLGLHYDCSLSDPENRRKRFFIARLPGSGSCSLGTTVVAYRRGLHFLGPLIVEASAPFGLFRRRVGMEQRRPVLVYPQVLPIKRLELVDGLAGEALRPQKARTGLETAGSRPYFPGDPRRYIHWRNTARAGRPMVKEFEDPRDQALDLLFDSTQVWGEDRDTTLEYGIKVVAGVAAYARRRGVPVRVWGGNLRGASAGGPGDDGARWTELLRSLALVSAGDGVALGESMGRMSSGASVLAVISAGDRQGLRSLGLAATTLRRLLVVALEEFGEPAPGDDLLESLERARIPVARCGPGQLPWLLQRLERLGLPAREAIPAA